MSGNLTDAERLRRVAAFMDAEVLVGNACQPWQDLSNFADKTASAQLPGYQATAKFGLGAAVKYESKKYAGQPDSAVGV